MILRTEITVYYNEMMQEEALRPINHLRYI